MTIDAPTFRRPLAGIELDRALSGLAGGALRERRSLERERDPLLYSESLLSLAGREERANRPELATRIYAEMLQSPDTPPALRDRAGRRLAAWRGEGEIGDRAEVLLSRFTQELFEPTSLFAMGVAGTAFRMGRFLSLARLAASPTANFFTRGLGARALAGLTGFGVEALAFPLAGRLGNLALGRQQTWTVSALGRETASSFLFLGALRAGGFVAGHVGSRTWLRPLAQQAGMFGGILLGQELEVRAGLRERTNSSIALVDGLASLFQFNAAGRLSRSLTSEGLRNWERAIEVRSAALESPPLIPPFGKGGLGGIFPEPLLAGIAERSNRPPDPLGPDRVYMSKDGEGGGGRSTAEIFMRAATLRIQITPQDAWARRENLTRDYLELISQLPTGKASSLEEILLGVEMLGTWTSSSNHFLQSIGHRFYAQAWRILRDKYSHVETNFNLEQRILTNTILHRQLIAEGTNAGFLRNAVKASPAIVSLLHHHRLALQEGSPRDLAVVDALHQVLTALHMGAEMLPNPALRKTYLEAWYDSLQAVHATGELAAREVISGIRMLRLDLQAQDPERRALAAMHYPLFWQLFRTVTQTNSFHGLDFGMAEEIAFLQQNRDLKNTPNRILEPVLKAFPHYVDSQIALHDHHPLQLSIMLDTFVGFGQQFRGAFLLAKDPAVRERFVNTYVDVLRSCRRASLELLPWQYAFPRNVPQGVTGEMREGLAELRERWTKESGDFQIRSLDQYWRLAAQYPVAEGLADQLNSGPYLKPLSHLAGFNGNGELRKAAEELLSRLLNRFRADALRH